LTAAKIRSSYYFAILQFLIELFYRNINLDFKATVGFFEGNGLNPNTGRCLSEIKYLLILLPIQGLSQLTRSEAKGIVSISFLDAQCPVFQ
jgi:hypothetical protein